MNFLASYPFFFDGPEYVLLSRLPIWEALQLAHPLPHPISMWLWRISYLVFGSSVTALSLVSGVFWVMGAMLAARCVAKNRRFMVYIVCLLLPLPWLVMTNVLVDAVSTSLFLGGVVLLWRRRNWTRVVGATILFSLSILNYLGMAIWLAIPMAIIELESKLRWKKRIAMMVVVLTSAGMGLGGLIMMGLWTTNIGVGQIDVTVALYHAGVAFVANYTWISVVVVFGFGITWIMRREWGKLGWMVGIGLIYVISLWPWHSGPYGRLGVFIIYPLTLLYTRLPKWTLILVIALILPSWLRVARSYQGVPLPVIQQELIDSSICRDKQLVFSEIQRPQLSLIYPSAWYAGPANWEDVVVKINNGENICISQQALDYPYVQFEGQLPYPLSGRGGRRGFLSIALQEERVELVKTDPIHPELTIYQISR